MVRRRQALKPPARALTFTDHLRLLWGLRLTIGLNRADGRSRLVSIVAFIASSAPSIVIGWSFFTLMHVPIIAR